MPNVRVALADASYSDWEGVHALLVEAFAGMEGRIDPPSSLHRMPPEILAEMAQSQTVVLAHDGPDLVGCGFGEERDANRLYLSKLAVRKSHQRRGILRDIVDLFADQALLKGLAQLTLTTRVELAENHATFRALGFKKSGEARHPGFDRTTSLSFERTL